jgi:hypothetical protein
MRDVRFYRRQSRLSASKRQRYITLCLVKAMGKRPATKSSRRVGTTARAMRAIAQHHAQQIIGIRRAIAPIEDLLDRNGVKELLYSGTMMSQSGATPVAVIPVRLRSRANLDRLLAGPTPYAVLFVGGKLKLLQDDATIMGGAYLLVFGNRGNSWETRLVDANADIVATLSTERVAFQALRRGEDPREKAKKILKGMDIDLKLVDITIEFNGSTKVSVSFLLWDWDLFEDPPLPYLRP